MDKDIILCNEIKKYYDCNSEITKNFYDVLSEIKVLKSFRNTIDERISLNIGYSLIILGHPEKIVEQFQLYNEFKIDDHIIKKEMILRDACVYGHIEIVRVLLN